MRCVIEADGRVVIGILIAALAGYTAVVNIVGAVMSRRLSRNNGTTS
jgi:hypothetical protein